MQATIIILNGSRNMSPFYTQAPRGVRYCAAKELFSGSPCHVVRDLRWFPRELRHAEALLNLLKISVLPVVGSHFDPPTASPLYACPVFLFQRPVMHEMKEDQQTTVAPHQLPDFTTTAGMPVAPAQRSGIFYLLVRIILAFYSAPLVFHATQLFSHATPTARTLHGWSSWSKCTRCTSAWARHEQRRRSEISTVSFHHVESLLIRNPFWTTAAGMRENWVL